MRERSAVRGVAEGVNVCVLKNEGEMSKLREDRRGAKCEQGNECKESKNVNEKNV